MSEYGRGVYGGGFYGGKAIQYNFNPIAAFVEVYENNLTLKGFHQLGVGNFLGCNFNLADGGCMGFSLKFANYVDINKKDIIKIKLFDSIDYFFTGVVREVPIQGSTKNDYAYTGFGLNDYLYRLNTGSALTYTGQTIRTIVLSLLNNIVIPGSPIVKNLGKISSLTTVVSSITFKYIQISEALDQLKKIANADGNDYIVGVDREGDFIFKARSTEIKATLAVGKTGFYGITEYNPVDTYEAKSKLYVLKKDGTYYGTYTSGEDIDTFETKLTAPDIADADITNWANGQLKELEQETRQATIEWQIETASPTVLDADGTLRIISERPPTSASVESDLNGEGLNGEGLFGGEDYTGYLLDDILKIREVNYTIAENKASRQIQLGSLPVRMDRQMIEINKNIENLRVSLGR